MPIVLTRFPIAYYSTPKIASTSIKTALYELEHGVPFEPYQDANGKWWHIHNIWLPKEPSLFHVIPKAASYFKFCVVRDPIVRFLSAYGNRVHHHKELSQAIIDSDARAQELKLKADPDVDTFIDQLEDYCAVSYTINHHVRPQSDYLGDSLDYYDRAYEFSELAQLAADLTTTIGRPFVLPHTQKGGPKLKSDVLNAGRIRKLTDYYARDYALMTRFYKPLTAA